MQMEKKNFVFKLVKDNLELNILFLYRELNLW